MPELGTRLAPLPMLGTSRFVEVDGNRLHLLDYGAATAPTLVIVPGITSAAAIWEFVALELARDFRVLIVDLPGRGLSDVGEHHGLRDYARDIALATSELGLERPTIIGHSAGARVAVLFGSCYPELRGPLVIADPPLSGPGRPPYPTDLREFLVWIRAARAGLADDLRPYFVTLTDDQFEHRMAWLAMCDETAVVETYRAFHEDDLFESWRVLQPRVLFLWGGASPAVSADAAIELAEANPHAEMKCLPGAGHMLPWDDLAGFVSAIRRFHG